MFKLIWKDMEVLGKKSHGHAVISGDMPSIGRIEADLLFFIYFYLFIYFFHNLELKTKSREIKLAQISKEMLRSYGNRRAVFPNRRYCKKLFRGIQFQDNSMK